jgi:putative FmdB family regulatory protein
MGLYYYNRGFSALKMSIPLDPSNFPQCFWGGWVFWVMCWVQKPPRPFCSNIYLSSIMPIYAYRCASCGLAKDVLQKISDAPQTQCPACEQPTWSKQLSAPGFQLKGTGWYVTDFRNGANGSAGAAAAVDTTQSGGAASAGDSAAPAAASVASSASETSSTSKTESAPGGGAAASAASVSSCSPGCACH